MNIPKGYKGDKAIFTIFKEIFKDLKANEGEVMRELHAYATAGSYRVAVCKDWKLREEHYFEFVKYYSVLLPIIEGMLRDKWEKAEI